MHARGAAAPPAPGAGGGEKDGKEAKAPGNHRPRAAAGDATHGSAATCRAASLKSETADEPSESQLPAVPPFRPHGSQSVGPEGTGAAAAAAGAQFAAGSHFSMAAAAPDHPAMAPLALPPLPAAASAAAAAAAAAAAMSPAALIQPRTESAPLPAGPLLEPLGAPLLPRVDRAPAQFALNPSAVAVMVQQNALPRIRSLFDEVVRIHMTAR